MNSRSSRFVCLAFTTLAAGGILLLAQTSPSPVTEVHQDWTNYVRIGAYGLKGGDAAQIVRRAQESDVSGLRSITILRDVTRASSIQKKS